MHRVRHLLPRRDLGVRVDAGNAGVAACLGRDEGRFGDEQRAGDAGALGVVFRDEVEGDVGVVGAEAGEGGHDEAGGEGEVADFEGGEEAGVGGHGGRWWWVLLVSCGRRVLGVNPGNGCLKLIVGDQVFGSEVEVVAVGEVEDYLALLRQYSTDLSTSSCITNATNGAIQRSLINVGGKMSWKMVDDLLFSMPRAPRDR